VIERILIGLGLVAALVFGAYLYGRDSMRAEFINAQLTEEVRINKRQSKETIKEVIKWVKVKEKHDEAMPALARDIVRRCVLSDGAALRPGRSSEGMPGDGQGALGQAPTEADEADRRWCEQLAADYAAGVSNTDSLAFALGWIAANGGKPVD
jgi:hypothetical protein